MDTKDNDKETLPKELIRRKLMSTQFSKLLKQIAGRRDTNISRDSRSVQGTFKSAFYLQLDKELLRNNLIRDGYWEKATVLDCGAGCGLALFGFNFLLNCKKLYGIEILSNLVALNRELVDILVQHNENRTNWTTIEISQMSVDDMKTRPYYQMADFVISLNIKFDAIVNDGMLQMIECFCKSGTIILTLVPLNGQRRTNASMFQIGSRAI